MVRNYAFTNFWGCFLCSNSTCPITVCKRIYPPIYFPPPRQDKTWHGGPGGSVIAVILDWIQYVFGMVPYYFSLFCLLKSHSQVQIIA